MVFGFGKKKPAEEPVKQVESEIAVTLHDIPSIIRDLEVPRVERTVMGAKGLKEDIRKALKNIHSIASQLEKDDLKLDDIDKNLKTIGKRGKDAVVSTINKETSVELPDIASYEDVMEIYSEVNQILKRIGDILGLHTRVMHVFARKYADKLKEEIGGLSQSRNLLQGLISEQEKFTSDSRTVLEMVDKIHSLNDKLAKQTHRIEEIATEKAGLFGMISALERDISGTKSREEYRQFLEIKGKIEACDMEEHSVRDRINAQFSKISRPLNKYTYVSSFDKPMKKIMEDLIADPYRVVLPENRGHIIEILQAAAKSVMAGNVSVKDSERSVELIEETIEHLDEFFLLKAGQAKKKSELESRLGTFDAAALERKEKDLQKAKVGLSDLEAITKKLEVEISQDRASLASEKTGLESSLSRLNNTRTVVRFQG